MYRKREYDRDYDSHHNDEVEKSVKMIAEFVKHEIDDIKRKTVSARDIDDELGALKEELLEKIEKTESRASSAVQERRLSKIEAELSDLKHMKSKHDDIEKKVTDIHSKISSKVLEGSQIDKNLVDAYLRRMEELERNVDNLKQIVSKESHGVLAGKMKESLMEQLRSEFGTPAISDSTRRALDDRIDELNAHIEELRNEMNALGAVKAENVDSYISDIKSAHKMLEDFKAEDVAGRAKKIEGIGKVIENLRSGEVREYINSMRDIKRVADLMKDENLRGRMDEIRNVKHELDAIKSGEIKGLHDMVQEIKSQHTAEKISEISRALEAVKSNEIHAQAEEIARMHGMLQELKSEDMKLHAEELKSVKEIIDRLKSEDMKTHISQMKELKHTIDALKDEDLKAHAAGAKQMQETIERLKSEEVKNRMEQVKAFNATVKKMDTEEMKRYEDVLVQMEQFKYDLEGALGKLKAENDRHYGEVEKHREQLKSDVEDSLKRIENEDAKRYSELNSSFSDLSENVSDVRKTLDEETAVRLSTDKRIGDILKQIKNVSSEIAAVKEGEAAIRAEIADSADKLKKEEQSIYAEIAAALGKMKNVEEDFETRLKQEAMNVVASQLNEFAGMMDRKMPNLATKDDLARIESGMAKRATEVRHAPTEGIERRIVMLERRIGDLVESFQGYQGSYVIE